MGRARVRFRISVVFKFTVTGMSMINDTVTIPRMRSVLDGYAYVQSYSQSLD